MIGQGLKAHCPRCNMETPCLLRERVGQDGLKEFYLECSFCKKEVPWEELGQENIWHRKAQKAAQMGKVFFVVKGEPVPQGRPRFASVQGRFVHAYDPQKSVIYKNLIKWHIRQFQMEYPSIPELKSNIFLELKIFRPIPASFSKRKRQLIAEGMLFPNTKPDTDNYVKTVLDAANGMLFKDDSAVIGILARKYYSDNPRIEVMLCETKDNFLFGLSEIEI